MPNAFLFWLEATPFSSWMRESPSVFAFPMILAAHTVGLGLIAGINVALDLRLLGVAARIPVAQFKRFVPFMWMGLAMNVVSGVALLIAYPTKALTNPVFYLKLALIAVALVLLRTVRREALANGGMRDSRATRVAVASLLCWAGAITAGRLLAYTYTRLFATGL